MKAIKLTFVVKNEQQEEIINMNLIARVLVINNTPYIGMAGQSFTRQISVASYNKLVEELKK